MQNNILYKCEQDGNKTFDALVISKSMAHATPVNSQNFQGHVSTTKTYLLIERDFFWKGMCDIS